MKTVKFNTSALISILTVLACVIPYGCNQMSETVQDEAAGTNGSFEIVESGLPVNWLLYTPKTVPEGDFDLVIDTDEYKDGKQSLKFLVRECASTGGWSSPGLANEYEANPGETYLVSFWVKNNGTEFIIRTGGVSAFEGQYETIVKSGETIDSWRKFEYKYIIPPEMNAIRFELNILQPGSFWIDDVKIIKIDDGSN